MSGVTFCTMMTVMISDNHYFITERALDEQNHCALCYCTLKQESKHNMGNYA